MAANKYYWLLLVESHLTQRLFSGCCGGSQAFASGISDLQGGSGFR